jgi:hypothetical protein
MAANQIPVVDRIRIIPRPDDFLDRNIGSSGEVFFNKATSSLRVYSGKDRSGFEIARADLSNVSNDTLVQKLTDAGYESGGNSVEVGDNPPANPESGNIWLETDTGILYVYYQDGDTAQWIQPTTSTTGSSATPTFKTIQVDGQGDIVAESSTDSLHIVAGSNINIDTNAATNTLTINATVTGGGGGVTTNSFTTFNVAGQSAVVAETETDTLTLAAGSGITLTTDATTDTITITNTQAAQVNNFSSLNESTTAGLTIDKFYRPAMAMLEVDNVSASAYTFNSHYTGNNPRIYAISGTTIAFNLDAVPGHPFQIQTNAGVPYSTGLTHVATDGTVTTGANANGKDSGTLYWTIDESINTTFRYQCTNHAAMVGLIEVKQLSLL